jgi:hypothetical protein
MGEETHPSYRKEYAIGYEIVRVEIQLFRRGLVLKGSSNLKRYNMPKRDELWWPIDISKSLVVVKTAPDEVRFEQDSALIRVTPISTVADGLFNGDIDFRLTLETVYDVFGKSLERFVKQAWEMFITNEHQETWRCFAFMTVYENAETNDKVPVFRGFLPLDESLLTVTIDPVRVA